MKILVTGAAGFIGFHISRRLLEDGHKVIGLDNVNVASMPEQPSKINPLRISLFYLLRVFKFIPIEPAFNFKIQENQCLEC